MFIAHAPTGYLLSVPLLKKFKFRGLSKRMVQAACIVGSVAPDFDFLYYFTLGTRGISHRTYVTHMPWFWLSLLALCVVWALLAKQSKAAMFAVLFCLGCLNHLFFDSFMSGICWLAPWDTSRYMMLNIPERTLPLLQHYTKYGMLQFELSLCVLALGVATYRWWREKAVKLK